MILRIKHRGAPRYVRHNYYDTKHRGATFVIVSATTSVSMAFRGGNVEHIRHRKSKTLCGYNDERDTMGIVTSLGLFVVPKWVHQKIVLCVRLTLPCLSQQANYIVSDSVQTSDKLLRVGAWLCSLSIVVCTYIISCRL